MLKSTKTDNTKEKKYRYNKNFTKNFNQVRLNQQIIKNVNTLIIVFHSEFSFRKSLSHKKLINHC